MKKKFYIIIAIVVLILIAAAVLGSFYFKKDKADKTFESDILFLKISISQNGSAVNNVKITNINNIKESFSAEIIGLKNLASLENYQFDLDPKEEGNIKIIFKTDGEDAGVYLGKLKITSNEGSKDIPIILEIESKDVLFDSNINVFPQGRDIILGQSINAEIKIFDLAGIGRSNVDLDYSVKDFDGGTLVSESETLVVDGKLDYSKVIDLNSAKPESYVLAAVVKKGSSVGVASYYFNVFEEKSEVNIESGIIWIIAIFVFFFLVFLALFIYSFSYRDKLLRELQNEYKREIKRQDEIIREKGKLTYSKLRTPIEKKIYRKEVRKIKKERIKTIKEIHKKRLKEYHRIKKRGKKDELKRQLQKWKRQGYETKFLEEKYKVPNVNDIRKKIQEWKAKGYNTSFLEKRKV